MHTDEKSLTVDSLNEGWRYHIWYSVPSTRTAHGFARGSFTDVFRSLELGNDKQQYATFYEQPKLDTRHITFIKLAEPGRE